MKILKKIILSLLIAAGISNVSLKSMIKNRVLVSNGEVVLVPGTNTAITLDMITRAGFRINGSRRVCSQNGKFVLIDDVANNVLNSFIFKSETEGLPVFDHDAEDATRAELREEERNGLVGEHNLRDLGENSLRSCCFYPRTNVGNVSWGFRQKVQGLYYDLDDTFGLEDKFIKIYGSTKGIANGVAVKVKTAVNREAFSKLKKIVDDFNTEYGRRIILSGELVAGGFAVVRLLGAASGMPVTLFEQLLESAGIIGVIVYEIKRN